MWTRTAGTWALPDTEKKALQLVKYVQGLDDYTAYSKEDVESKIYNLYGDDVLFDDIDAITKGSIKEGQILGRRVKMIVKHHIKELISHYESNPDDFKRPFQDDAIDILKQL